MKLTCLFLLFLIISISATPLPTTKTNTNQLPETRVKRSPCLIKKLLGKQPGPLCRIAEKVRNKVLGKVSGGLIGKLGG